MRAKLEEITKKKSEIIGRFVFDLFFEKPSEVSVYFILAHYFVSKINQKIKRIKTIDVKNGSCKNFFHAHLGFKKLLDSRKVTRSSKLQVKSIGKYFLFKGIVVQVGKMKQRIKSILMECSKCQSVFFCLFEYFVTDYLFLCVKKNCKSKFFFSYTHRINVIFWQRLKVYGVPTFKNSGENTLSIDIETFGASKKSFKVGDLVLSRGILKISNTEKEAPQNVFYFCLQSYQINILSQRIKEKKRFFLTKKEYSFFNKLKTGSSLFVFFMKTMDSIFFGHNSLKAGILLLISHLNYSILNDFQGSQRFTCLVMIDQIRKINCFREMIDIIPKSFSFDLKNLQSFNKSQEFEKKEINLKLVLKNFLKQGKKIIYIEETEKEEDIDLFKAIQKIKKITFEIGKRSPFHLIAGIKPILGFYKSNFNFFQRSSMAEKFSSFFDLIFILVKKKNNPSDKKNSKKFAKFFSNNVLVPGGTKSEKERCFFGKKKKNPFFTKKRFSRFFFRRLFLFVQNEVNPLISENVSMILVEFYKSMKIFPVDNFISKRIRCFEIVLQLGKCRAKIDLRKTVSVEDIIDAMEIISDTACFSRENWESVALEKKFRGFQNIWAIRKLSKKLRQNFSRKKQTIFDTRIMGKNLNQKSDRNRIFEIMEILTKSNLIEKKNEQFFRIGKNLKKIQ